MRKKTEGAAMREAMRKAEFDDVREKVAAKAAEAALDGMERRVRAAAERTGMSLSEALRTEIIEEFGPRFSAVQKVAERELELRLGLSKAGGPATEARS